MGRRFSNPPLWNSDWVTLSRAAELTGQTLDAIKAVVSTGLFTTKAILIPGMDDMLVDRGQIVSFFSEQAAA